MHKIDKDKWKEIAYEGAGELLEGTPILIDDGEEVFTYCIGNLLPETLIRKCYNDLSRLKYYTYREGDPKLIEVSSGSPMPDAAPPKTDKGKIKSDGGSSSYYLVTLPEGSFSLNKDGSISFMLEEYIKYGLSNNFDAGNLAKANHRFENKEGNTAKYEKNKMHHYVDRR